MNKKIIIVGAVVVVVVAAGALAASRYFGGSQAQRRIYGAEPVLTYNAGDIREVAGVSTDIFVGRVIEQLKTVKPERSIVQTLFSVQVIKMLKGSVEGVVTVSQSGGLYKGQWTIISGDIGIMAEGTDDEIYKKYFLRPGQTYLFTTSHRGTTEWYHMTPTPTPSQASLGIDPSVKADEAKAMADSAPAVKAMEEAIANEIVPEAIKRRQQRLEGEAAAP